MVDASENEAPSEVSFTSSFGNAAQDYLTEEELKFLGAPPLCFHQRPCILFVTRKEGANLGRIFWRCPMARGQQCKAFVWTKYQPTWQEQKDRRSQPPSRRSQTSTGRIRVSAGHSQHGRDGMQTQASLQVRDQCLCDQGEVHGLRNGFGRPEEDHRGDAGQDQGGSEPAQEGLPERILEKAERPTVDESYSTGLDSERDGDGGLRGLPEVLGVEEATARPEVAERMSEIRERLELRPAPADDRQWARLQKQSEAALNRAELLWIDLMSLISTDPGPNRSGGRESVASQSRNFR